MKFLLLLLVLTPLVLTAQDKRAMTVEDLWSMKRIGTYDVSPDGKTIAFSVTTYDMNANKGNTDIYLIDSDGKNLRPLKNSDKNESEPKFSPDGKKIAFTMDDQIWVCDLDGSNTTQLTDIYTGASGFEWSHDGKKMLFVSSVYPECPDQQCDKQKDEEKKESKVNAKLFTHLMYRHWNEWRNGKRSHLFLFDVASKKYTDLNLLSRTDTPPLALGSSNDYNFSPDDKEISYTKNLTEIVSHSTNNDVFTVKLSDIQDGYEAPATKFSESKGNDNQPVYSPDGKYIAFTSMKTPGFEADKQDLVLYDRSSGTLKTLTNDFNLSVGEFIWTPNSKEIYFTAENEIYNSIFKIDIATSKISLIYKDHVNDNISISQDGKTIYFRQERAELPYELFSMNADGSNVKQITFLNKDLLSKLELNPIETFLVRRSGRSKSTIYFIKTSFLQFF